jgi:hypothetical protein
VIDSGLEAGNEAVTVGALILGQLFEDQRIAATGLPSDTRFSLYNPKTEDDDVAHR